MNRNEIKTLFAILKSAISGEKINSQEIDGFSCEMLPDLLKLSSKHDVAHLVAWGLKQNGLVSKDDASVQKYILDAIYRYERINYEYERLCSALEKAQIAFLPLKGAVLRKHYREAWMRTSCDIDILVHEKDCERATSCLINDCGYSYHSKSSHDISIFTPTNIHIELHYDLIEGKVAKKSSQVLKNVWETSVLREGCAFWYEMTYEMFYFYHIAHMAKHFEVGGGCGIRTYMDIWVLDSIEGATHAKRDELLRQGDLLQFANVTRKLSRIWFGNEAYDEITRQMEEFILRGGTYGDNGNRIIVQQQKKGGRLKYALSRIFRSYDIIKYQYPILMRHRWLTPFMEVRRWCKLIFCGHAKRTLNELKYNNSISRDAAVDMQVFLKNIGLQ